MHYLHIVHTQPVDAVDKNLITPAHIVCNNGQLGTFKYLLKQDRCKIDSLDIWGNSVLHLAAANGSASLCWEIVSHSAGGAKLLKIRDRYDRTPFDVIKDSRSVGLVCF